MSIAVPLYGFGASGGTGGKLTVTAPANVTVTITKDGKTKTKNSSTTGVAVFKGLASGTWTVTISGDGKTAQKTVVVTTDYSTAISFNAIPEFTYTGDFEIVNDSDEPITVSQDNWKIRFLTSGTLTFTNLNGGDGLLDVFLVGGGGGGAYNANVGITGGGGGYTTTARAIHVSVGQSYDIQIGAGGNSGSSPSDGGATSALGKTALGGKWGRGSTGGAGGSGGGGYVHSTTTGSGAGAGGSDGSNGGSGSGAGGTGQGTTTREFGESTGKLYAGGGASNVTGSITPIGGAGGGGNPDASGEANTGGGCGGTSNSALHGGSGIVIIRNAREAA